MDKGTCETCRFWDGESLPDESVGLCRRYPPQFNPRGAADVARFRELARRPQDGAADAQETHSWALPVTCLWGWCGEWKAKDAVAEGKQ